MILFDVQKLVNFMSSYLTILGVICCLTGILSRQFSSISIQSRGFLLAVSAVWVWNPGALIHLELISSQGERYGSNPILLSVEQVTYFYKCTTLILLSKFRRL